MRRRKGCLLFRRKIVLWILASTLFEILVGSLYSHAQQIDSIILPPLDVSASRISSSTSDTPSSITIITREQIEVQQPSSVIELLRLIPGLHIDNPGGRGSISSVYIRGGDPNFIPVLIDGVKINDSTNNRGGSFDFSKLGVENIKRIEIVRGSMSSVYGSDAMGGLINIITREGKGTPRASAEGTIGTDDFYSTIWDARGKFQDIRFSAAGSYLDNGTPVEGDRFIAKSFNGKATASLFKFGVLKISGWYTKPRAESFPDDSGGPVFAVLRETESRNSEDFSLGIELRNNVFSFWEYQINGSLFKHRAEEISPGVAPGIRDPFGIPPNRSDNQYRRTNLLINNVFNLSKMFTFSFGGEIQQEKGRSESELDFGGFISARRFSLKRKVYSYFMESSIRFPFGAKFDSGVRVDIPERFNTEISPRFGFHFPIKKTHTTLKATWGRGFKLPSFFSLANPIVGNPQLVPETSESFDLGISQKFDGGQGSIELTYFENRFFDLIDLEEGPPPILVNRSTVKTKGIEAQVNYVFSKYFSINGSITYTKTNIIGTDEKLRNRPRLRGGLSVLFRPDKKISVFFRTYFVGKIQDSSIPTGDQNLDSYRQSDLSIKVKPTPNWRFGFTVNNLFDEDYEQAVGFPAPGIRPRISIRYTF